MLFVMIFCLYVCIGLSGVSVRGVGTGLHGHGNIVTICLTFDIILTLRIWPTSGHWPTVFNGCRIYVFAFHRQVVAMCLI